MGIVFSVSNDKAHQFSKHQCSSIHLIQGEGVEGDAHCGVTVKHRSRVKTDPTQPNLRQIHFIHNELLEELKDNGFDVSPSTLGENITTKSIDLLSLPRGTKLNIGSEAIVEITGLRNPCKQLDNYQKGLTAAVLDRDNEGNIIRKAGVMGVVLNGGIVSIGDSIKIEFPPKPHHQLERV